MSQSLIDKMFEDVPKFEPMDVKPSSLLKKKNKCMCEDCDNLPKEGYNFCSNTCLWRYAKSKLG